MEKCLYIPYDFTMLHCYTYIYMYVRFGEEGRNKKKIETVSNFVFHTIHFDVFNLSNSTPQYNLF